MSLTIIPRTEVGEYKKIPFKTKGINFPKFEAFKIMFVIEGTNQELALWYSKFKWWQHKFYNKKTVQFMGMQGEFSSPSPDFPQGRPHIQGAIIMKRGRKISSIAILKMFQPEKLEQVQLQIGYGLGSDIIHYISKPHDLCDCKHCTKARLCKPNWAPYIMSGIAPVGQGNKFAQLKMDVQSGAKRGQIIENHMGLYLRYGNNIDKIIEHYQLKNKMESCQNPMQAWDPKIWMIIEAAKTFLPKKKRTVVWIWSYKLKTCKTSYIHWLIWLHGFSCIPDVWSFKDIISMYRNENLLTFNFPKHTDWESDETKRKLTLIERMDDGYFMATGKYQGKRAIMDSHIIVTANNPPPECWAPDDPDTRVTVIHLDPPAKRIMKLNQPRPKKKRKISPPETNYYDPEYYKIIRDQPALRIDNLRLD